MNRELVMEFLTNGYNCSQSVLCYFAEEFNPRPSRPQKELPKLLKVDNSKAQLAELCVVHIWYWD